MVFVPRPMSKRTPSKAPIKPPMKASLSAPAKGVGSRIIAAALKARQAKPALAAQPIAQPAKPTRLMNRVAAVAAKRMTAKPVGGALGKTSGPALYKRGIK